jgi:hypothetical protein
MVILAIVALQACAFWVGGWCSGIGVGGWCSGIVQGLVAPIDDEKHVI